jgi:hypothetical protein
LRAWGGAWKHGRLSTGRNARARANRLRRFRFQSSPGLSTGRNVYGKLVVRVLKAFQSSPGLSTGRNMIEPSNWG